MSKQEKLREILKKYGVTKCNISTEFDFYSSSPNGDITVNVKSSKLDSEIYKLFTISSDGLVDEEQSLGVWYDDFSDGDLETNFNI